MAKTTTIRVFISCLLCLTIIHCNNSKTWYRGNTHAHTVICGHADSPPEVVAQWYLDHGYNFLILSEHNHFINPDSVSMPSDRREDFILIAGEEISGPKIVHSTAMNIQQLVSPPTDLDIKSEIIQNHVDGAIEAGGNAILNHPNFHYTLEAKDILPVQNLYMFELFNGHPKVNNFGDKQHPSTETLWDQLLSKGMRIYGVSSDDAHHFSKIDTQYSNPGRGWVMVLAAELTSSAISAAMMRGDFYSSNGVFLAQCSFSDGSYRIKIDTEKTENELTLNDLRGQQITTKKEGYVIEFIGAQGKVLSVTDDTEAYFLTSDSIAYVRAKVTFRRSHPTRGMEEFYAWGQPAFMDTNK